MVWIETEWQAVVNVVMNIPFQKCWEFLAYLRTCLFLKQHCAAWHCINTAVQTLRWKKAVPCRTDSSVLLPVTVSPALFLQSTFPSPGRSVPPVNITPSTPLWSSSQHPTLQSSLFLQSTFPYPVRSVPPVSIPICNPLCSSSQNYPLQSATFPKWKLPSLKSALFVQATFPTIGRFFLQ